MDSIEEIRAERDELQQVFDLQWEADQRAIKLWREATGQDMVWPDKSKLTGWLLAEIDRLKAENERLRTLAIEQRLAGIEDGVYIAEQEDQSHG